MASLAITGNRSLCESVVASVDFPAPGGPQMITKGGREFRRLSAGIGVDPNPLDGRTIGVLAFVRCVRCIETGGVGMVIDAWRFMKARPPTGACGTRRVRKCRAPCVRRS